MKSRLENEIFAYRSTFRSVSSQYANAFDAPELREPITSPFRHVGGFHAQDRRLAAISHHSQISRHGGP